MPRYDCVELDASAQSCVAWAEQPSIPDWLPDVDQAQDVGFAFFASIAVIASMSLLFPRSKNDE